MADEHGGQGKRGAKEPVAHLDTSSYNKLLEEVTARLSLSRNSLDLLALSNSSSSGLARLFEPAKSERESDLEKHTSELKLEVGDLQRRLEAERKAGAATKETVRRLEEKIKELTQSQALGFLLDRIHPDARNSFLESEEFQAEFRKRCKAFVLAVDLRRSTELMLKAREPELFAQFLSFLSNGLRAIVLAQHGVFEKFTGDGILAFFPEFYTGPDAAHYALSTANQCHRFFTEHYRKSYACFDAVLSLKDVGLGVGIDYGDISLVRVGEELSIVGNPVVYACRLASTRAGNTLLNQHAYEKVLERDKLSTTCSIVEDEIEVKHEARHLAYSVSLNTQPYAPSEPSWQKFAKTPPPNSIPPRAA